MKPTTILLAGGRRLLREGMCVLLERHPDLRVLGDASDFQAALTLASSLEPDLLLLSIGTGVNLVEALAQLRTARPSMGVILLLPSLTAYEVRAALAAGAAGCLSRECASSDLLAAVDAVRSGQSYVSSRLKEALLDALLAGNGNTQSRTTRLSAREREVLRRIASGRSTKEIAAELKIGSKTVETHRRRMMEKLDRRSVAELTQYAMLHGLLDGETSARDTDQPLRVDTPRSASSIARSA